MWAYESNLGERDSEGARVLVRILRLFRPPAYSRLHRYIVERLRGVREALRRE